MSSVKTRIINDLKNLAKKHSRTNLSRDFYRQNGKFSERQWQKHFPTFKDFAAAADLDAGTPTKQEPESHEHNGDTWNVTLPKTSIHTLEELLDYCKVDTLLWEVERFTVNKWDANAGHGTTMPLYQVKATLKKRKEIAVLFEEIAKMRLEAKDWAPIPKPIVRAPISDSGNMLEVNIPDLHLGKLAWSEETGYLNYDTNIAITRFYEALEGLILRVKHFKFEEVVFVVGNDLMQADNEESATYSGTRVDTDSRYKKTFNKARVIMTTAIERLRQIAPVRVVIVEGNHDRQSMFFLGEILACQFMNYEDVTVDNSPKNRKYHRFGANLLLFTHGDKGKRQDFPLLMAAEEPVLWGATKFREVHTGHLHQTKTEEFHGVRVRILPALCEPDAWHSSNAFTNHLRVAEAYVWNKQEGLITQAFYGA